MIKLRSIVLIIVALINITSVLGCSNSTIENITEQDNSDNKTNLIGAMTPQLALEYMKSTPNLVIVDVATEREYNEKHFKGAINIHYSQMADRYNEISPNSTVILHCRLGMVVPNAYRVLIERRKDIKELSYIDGAPLFDLYNTWIDEQQTDTEQYLNGLSPDKALEYMKSTPNLVIIDVREPQWIGNTYFKGAMFIPHSEMADRYKEIPNDRPVILNCGAGVMAPRAYQTLLDVKADILQLSYIAGAPLFSEYNRWIEQQ